MSMEAFIMERAASLGFAAAGIARAGASRSWPRYRQWLDAGMHAGMSYLARRARERETPAALLRRAPKLAVAARYPSRGSRWYSNCAGLDITRRWGFGRGCADDIAKRAEGRSARGRVDTAPLLERERAVRSAYKAGRTARRVGAGCCVHWRVC